MFVLFTQLVGERRRSAIVGVDRRVERREVVRLCDLETFEDLFLGDIRGLGDLSNGWRPPEVVAEVADDLRQLEVELLKPTRHPNRPALIAEVTFQLPNDRGRGIGRELDLSF